MSGTNVLLVGANFINKGAEAMAKTVRQELAKAAPDLRCAIVVTADQAEAARASGFVPLFDPPPSAAERLWRRGSSALRKRLTGEGLPFADVTPLRALGRELPSLALGIDLSGYAYHDGRGWRQPLETLKAIGFCRERGAPYRVMPQAWGPFSDARTAANTRRMLEEAASFHARDRVSAGYLEGLLGRPEGSLPVVPDIAFGLETPPPSLGEALLGGAFARSADRPLVAISPNMRVYEKTPGREADNAYLRALVELCRHLAERHRAQFVLVPNEIHVREGFPDDRGLCRLLHDALGQAGLPAEDRALVDGYHTAEAIKSVIGLADVLVASRFHSLIFGLSQGVPSMAISWSHKYRELLALFGLEDWVVEDRDIDAALLCRRADALLEERAAWRERIEAGLVDIRGRIAEPLSALRTAVGGGPSAEGQARP
jgi:colanic acid/amylovoran biosynthesis protein